MSRPLGELQEAVEMLNDAAKERERVMEVAAETESLERLVGNGGRGRAARYFICSWTCWLIGTGHALQLSSVGHKGFMGTTLCKASFLVFPMAGTCPFLQLHGRVFPGWGGLELCGRW